MTILRGLLGLIVIVAAAWVFSNKRRAINWQTVATGLALQIFFAFLVLRWEYGRFLITKAGDAVNRLLAYSYEGSAFVFAFQVLPTIIFIAALFAILYHYGVMQFIINIAAWVMRRAMGVSGVESLDVAASIFMGQTEAPLTIRPFLARVTESELMVIMTAGMAHVSGGIMAAYIATGVEAKHLLTAVIMTAPGTLTIAKMLVPETQVPETSGVTKVHRDQEEKHENVLGAAAKGTSDGLGLAINVIAMLISFIALIYLLNGVLGGTHNFLAAHGFRWFPPSLESIFGVVFAPVAWLIGIPWHDCRLIGNLLGTRMALNELVA